jgi:hypothetical protein
MTAAELQQAAKALAAMFSCFPQSALADVEMQMRGYLAAVQDAELADVQAAIQRFIRGEARVDNAQFCPSSAQLSIEVRERHLMRELIAKRRTQPAVKLVKGQGWVGSRLPHPTSLRSAAAAHRNVDRWPGRCRNACLPLWEKVASEARSDSVQRRPPKL